jgi:ABC-2 type transport system permease protein
MRAVYRKELKSYFNTLSAYIFISAVLFVGGAAFATVNIGGEATDMDSVLQSIQYALFAATPIITMRLAGVDRTLLSAPVRIGAIVAGKYFAAFTVLAVSLAASLIYPVILALLGEPSWSETGSGLLGLLLLGGLLISLGQLIASLTEKKAAAGALGLCAMLLVLIMQALLPRVDDAGDALVKATPLYHVNAFISGIVGITDAVYFISISALLLFISARATAYRMRFR